MIIFHSRVFLVRLVRLQPQGSVFRIPLLRQEFPTTPFNTPVMCLHNMAELIEPFASFWAFLCHTLDESHFNQMFDHFASSLMSVLQNPFAVGYTPMYLAYRTILDSLLHGCMLTTPCSSSL